MVVQTASRGQSATLDRIAITGGAAAGARRDHSGSMLKPVQRPKTTTRAQQLIEIPPASLADSGGVGSRSHFCTLRTVMNSNTSMLIPASTMMDILIQNVVLTKYSVALLANRSEPAAAAITKATQV